MIPIVAVIGTWLIAWGVFALCDWFKKPPAVYWITMIPVLAIALWVIWNVK